MSAWAEEILEESLSVAELLDNFDTSNSSSGHQKAVEEQLAKVRDTELTPSARVLAYMREQRVPYFPFALKQSENSAEFLKNKLSNEKFEVFKSVSEKSNRDREKIEQSDNLSFDEFLVNSNKV